MGSPRLGLIILAVDDVPRAAQFYRAVLGWSLAVDVPVYVEFVAAEGMRLGVYQREAFGKNTGRVPFLVPRGALAPTELYLYVDAPADALARAVDAGGRLLSEAAPRDWGDEAAYCSDPEGNVLVFARPLAAPPGR